MTSQQLLARAPAGRTGRRGFYETVPCVVCGQPFDRRNHPTRTVLPRKTCGRAECVDLNARRLQAAWRAAHPDACRAYEKKYRRANRAKINTADRASYARRKAAAGKEKTECVMCFAEFERPALGRHPAPNLFDAMPAHFCLDLCRQGAGGSRGLQKERTGLLAAVVSRQPRKGGRVPPEIFSSQQRAHLCAAGRAKMTCEICGKASTGRFCSEECRTVNLANESYITTPPEVIDFIMRSVNELMVKHFGQELDTAGVRVVDPCAGKGEFFARGADIGVLKKDGGAELTQIEIHKERAAEAAKTADQKLPGRVRTINTDTLNLGDLP